LENKENNNLRLTKPLVVKLQTADFEKIDLSGAVKFNLHKGLKNEKFTIEASGASKLTLDSLQIDDLKLYLSGATKAELSGRVKNTLYDLSGASKINANELISNKVEIDASGASYVTCHATETLTGEISGASNVVFSGEPTTNDIDISGAGKVSRK
jgi:hypothetical protein